MAFVQDRFDTLRKPNGKPYKHPQGNIKRSIMCSLTSNGVFQKVTPCDPTTQNSGQTV